MATKKRKVDAECRVFTYERGVKYFFVEKKDQKNSCLICSESVAVLKECNLRRHYEIKHLSTYSKFSAKLCSEKYESIKRGLETQRDLFRRKFAENESVTRTCYKIVHKMAERGIPFTDGNYIKESSYRYDCSSPIVEQTPSAGESIVRCGNIRATGSTGGGSFVSIGGTEFGQRRNTGQSGGEGIKRKIEEVSEVYNVASVSNDVAEVRNEGAKYKKRPRLSQNIEVMQQLREQNNQLRERTMCKICMNKEVAVVFLPCRHFVSCTDCAARQKDCPVCRNVVRRRVRALMA